MPRLTEHLAGNRRRLRQARELSQGQLGARAGLQQAYVSQLERGLQPTRTTHLDRLARALDVDVLELLGLDAPAARDAADPAPPPRPAAPIAGAVRAG
jgi:transcriptional regulator with XRE-family HTH domain